VTEVETLYLDSIAAARRWIYVENQYFTSGRLADAMAARLAEAGRPEIVLVVPRICSGWLEERTMGVGRRRLSISSARPTGTTASASTTRAAGSGDACPDLNVHAKVMIVDDVLARVGSSNLSNRSMGLDTECDLAFEARGDARVARGIAALRDRLLGEHLDVPPRAMRAAIERSGSLIRAVETLQGRERTLVTLTDDAANGQGLALADIAPIDLERPVAHAPFVAWLLPRPCASRSSAARCAARARSQACWRRPSSGGSSASARSSRTRRPCTSAQGSPSSICWARCCRCRCGAPHRDGPEPRPAAWLLRRRRRLDPHRRARVRRRMGAPTRARRTPSRAAI
jgi:hypothetical protein